MLLKDRSDSASSASHPRKLCKGKAAAEYGVLLWQTTMAIEQLKLFVGPGLSESELHDALHKHDLALSDLLTSNLHEVNLRADCDLFTITGVNFEDGAYSLSYQYSWSAHYGCKDADYSDDEEGEVGFQYVDGFVIVEFDVHEGRCPGDEL